MENSLREQNQLLREKPYELQWKEKLRKRINFERPCILKTWDQESLLDEYKFVPSESLIKKLELSVLIYDPDHLNVLIRDANDIRWEPPQEDPFPHNKNPESLLIEDSNFLLEYHTEPLNIIIKRKITEKVIFELMKEFIFADHYIEFSFKIPTNQFYGFGERLFYFTFVPGTYSLFTLDTSGEMEKGEAGYNAHGHHPLYLIKEKTNKWHINYIRNTHGQEMVYSKDNTIKFKMIGGIIDLNFFLGESPEQAIIKYHKYLGGWTLPAFWAMGHHQGKWNGYRNRDKLEDILKKYKENNLAIDSIWNDIEYQETVCINFSIDEFKFPLDEMKSLLEEYKVKWIPVIDVWIPAIRAGPAYDYPGVMDLVMKTPSGNPYVEELLGENIHIDFWNPEARKFWTKMLEQLRNKVYFEGIWIDANEGTKFQNYSIDTGQYYDYPFWPGKANWYKLAMLKPETKVYGGMEEFDVRDSNYILHVNFTYDYLKKTNPFPFILTRATSPGVGRYAAHFIPDYKSSWIALRISIASIFNFQIFGMPFSGGDLCGAGSESQSPPELCARWYQLGLFYPFMRNYHVRTVREDNSQEPFKYKDEYFETIKISIELRYAILKYYYTIIFIAEGDSEFRVGTYFKPINFVFFEDETLPSYGNTNLETQIMIGDGLMVAPTFIDGQTSRSVFFPNTRWFDLRDLNELDRAGLKNVKSMLKDSPPYFLRGGYIFYRQNSTSVTRSNQLNLEYEVIIAFNQRKYDVMISRGKIMDLEDLSEQSVWKNCIEKNCIMSLNAIMDYQKSKFAFWVDREELDIEAPGFFATKIVVLGVDTLLANMIIKAEITLSPTLDPSLKIAMNEKGDMMYIWADKPIHFKNKEILEISFN